MLYYKVFLPSSTTLLQNIFPYFKVLLQYYAVLQSTAPVLRCTTKYYSSTTLYYKVLLPSSTTLLQNSTPFYKVLTAALYYSVVQSTTQYTPYFTGLHRPAQP